MSVHHSSANYTWRKLRRNKGAMLGMVIIAMAVFTALLGYMLAPDGTPYANRIVLEIASKKPGYRQLFYKNPLENDIKKTTFLARLIHGTPDEYQWIPIQNWKLQGDSVIVEQLVDEGITETRIFPVYGRSVEHMISLKTFWLGTDKFGRDILSRLMIGVRVSLGVGFMAVIISLSLGILLGMTAGYFSGITDDIIMWFVNVVWSIPTLLLVFAFSLALGKGFWQVFMAVGLTLWVNVARLIRGQVLSIRELNYIEATRAMGFSHVRTLIRHILPNVMGPVMVIAASNFATAIVLEAGLSFLGIGVQPPQPSWGLMIKENYNFIITQNPALALAPGIAIMLLVLAFNLLGNGLRDALDVRN